jgi:hypothetical protein
MNSNDKDDTGKASKGAESDEGVSDEPLLMRLLVGQVASCGCITKTPDISHHDPLCTYRLLEEARREIERTQRRYIGITDYQLQRAASLCGETFEGTPYMIGEWPAGVDEDSGEEMPSGLYIWCSEYPDDGRMYLEDAPMPALRELQQLRQASAGELREQAAEVARITDRNGVTVELRHSTGLVRVYDQQGNAFATGPTGVMHQFYISQGETYSPGQRSLTEREAAKAGANALHDMCSGVMSDKHRELLRGYQATLEEMAGRK